MSPDRPQLGVLLELAKARLAPALPSGATLVEACAAGAATVRQEAGLLVFDYRASGVNDPHWGPVVRMMRGLVVDPSDHASPTRAWPSPVIGDCGPDSPSPDAAPSLVQEKLDGVLLVRLEHHGRVVWVGRHNLPPGVPERAASLCPDLSGLPSHLVTYWEFRGAGLGVPTTPPRDQLFLLDVIDRRDGRCATHRWLRKFAEAHALALPAEVEWPGSIALLLARLTARPPTVEGFVVRWPGGIRGRVVNPAYALLWEVVVERRAGAVLDWWLGPYKSRLEPFFDPQTRQRLALVARDLDAGVAAGEDVESVSAAFLASAGGSESAKW